MNVLVPLFAPSGYHSGADRHPDVHCIDCRPAAALDPPRAPRSPAAIGPEFVVVPIGRQTAPVAR